MNKIKTFIDELFELSVRYLGEKEVNSIKSILEEAEKYEVGLALKARKSDKEENNLIEKIRAQYYSDTLLTFVKNKISLEAFTSYLIDFGKLCLDFGEIACAEHSLSQAIDIAGSERKYKILIAQAFFYRAETYVRSTRWNFALSDIKKARQLYIENRDKKGLACVENLTAIVNSERGKLKVALKHYNEALKIFNKIKDDLWIGILEMNIGNLKTIQSEWDNAYTHYKRAMHIFENLMDFKRLALVRCNIGLLFRNKGELEPALTEFDRALDYATQDGYLLAKGLSYLGKGNIYALLEDFGIAIEFCNKALEIFYKLMDKVGLAETYRIKGVIQRDTSNYEIAETYLLTSLRLSTEVESKLNMAEVMYDLGILYRKWNKPDMAKKYLEMSRENFNKLGSKANLENINLILERTK